MKVSVIRDAVDHITEAALRASATNVVEVGSVLIVTRSGILRHTLPIAVTGRQVALNQDLKALIPYAGVLPGYVAWALRWAAPRILRECSKGGTTVQSVDTSELLRFKIPIAPTAEQHRIVAAIEEQFSRIDVGVRLLERARQNLRRMRAALFQALLRDNSNHDWPTVHLGFALARGRYGTSIKCSPDGAGLPVLRIPNVQAGRITFSDLKYASNPTVDLKGMLVDRGDILIIRTNGSRSLIGRAAVVPSVSQPTAFASYLIQLRLRSEVLDPHYLVAALSSPRMRAEVEMLAATTAGQYNISLDKLRSLRVPVPPLSAQEALVADAEAKQSQIDSLDQEIVHALGTSERLRASVLAAAFLGGLVPQDANDEPASSLLAHLQADQIREDNNKHRRTRQRSHLKITA